eukprot:scaffold10767_cov109-Skeletonema_marinoi.AAC.2
MKIRCEVYSCFGQERSQRQVTGLFVFDPSTDSYPATNIINLPLRHCPRSSLPGALAYSAQLSCGFGIHTD